MVLSMPINAERFDKFLQNDQLQLAPTFKPNTLILIKIDDTYKMAKAAECIGTNAEQTCLKQLVRTI